MTDSLPFLYATEKDIFDLLMSAKGKMSESALHAIAAQRGIFYSKKTQRHRLAADIALLPHDYSSLKKMIEKRESHGRNEKRTYVELPVALTNDDISEILKRYAREVEGEETVTTQRRRAHDVYVNVAYDEIDYSKTRLIQRQRKDAGIEFVIGENSTTIRMPATERARSIVDKLCDQINQHKRNDLKRNELSLAGLSADQRTMFFVNLMRSLPGYQLQNVVSIKCAAQTDEVADTFELDIEEEKSSESAIVGRINSAAFSGMNLLQSEEYQALRRNGFFITAVTWRSEQQAKPQDLLQFDVSFEEPKEGKGFRFGVRIARRLNDGTITNDFGPVEATRQPGLWTLVERTSADVLKQIMSPTAAGPDAGNEGAKT
jgi:hypothetical protein